MRVRESAHARDSEAALLCYAAVVTVSCHAGDQVGSLEGEVLTAHFSRDMLGIETPASVKSIVEETAHHMVLDVVFHIPSLAHAQIDAQLHHSTRPKVRVVATGHSKRVSCVNTVVTENAVSLPRTGISSIMSV